MFGMVAIFDNGKKKTIVAEDFITALALAQSYGCKKVYIDKADEEDREVFAAIGCEYIKVEENKWISNGMHEGHPVTEKRKQLFADCMAAR